MAKAPAVAAALRVHLSARAVLVAHRQIQTHAAVAVVVVSAVLEILLLQVRAVLVV
jgi:hypothetical protein